MEGFGVKQEEKMKLEIGLGVEFEVTTGGY